MTLLDTIAMIVGYIVIFCIGFTALVIMPLYTIGRHHAERNKEIYRREFKARYGIDPHIDPNQL